MINFNKSRKVTKDEVINKARVFSQRLEELYEDVPDGKLKDLDNKLEECFNLILPRKGDRRI